MIRIGSKDALDTSSCAKALLIRKFVYAPAQVLYQYCMKDYMDAPIKRVSAEDVPLPYSKEIELLALPNADKVVKAVKEIL